MDIEQYMSMENEIAREIPNVGQTTWRNYNGGDDDDYSEDDYYETYLDDVDNYLKLMIRIKMSQQRANLKHHYVSLRSKLPRDCVNLIFDFLYKMSV